MIRVRLAAPDLRAPHEPSARRLVSHGLADLPDDRLKQALLAAHVDVAHGLDALGAPEAIEPRLDRMDGPPVRLVIRRQTRLAADDLRAGRRNVRTYALATNAY